MKTRKEGTVIFIGSEASLEGKKKGSVYFAAKFALRGFAQALRDECAASHVKISMINPGMVKTSFFDPLSFEPGEDPCEHLLPEDVAEAVMLILNSRPGARFDEINLSPQKRVVKGKKTNASCALAEVPPKEIHKSYNESQQDPLSPLPQ